MLSLRIEATARTAAQIERAARAWAAVQPQAPAALADELQRAITLLAHRPVAGARSLSQPFPDLRRLCLSRIGCHLYYRAAEDRIVLLAFLLPLAAQLEARVRTRLLPWRRRRWWMYRTLGPRGLRGLSGAGGRHAAVRLPAAGCGLRRAAQSAMPLCLAR
jgi:plasmid stabilization system protein ParE